MDPFSVYEDILSMYLHKETIPYLKNAWNEPHRKFHNINHLNRILVCIERNKSRLSKTDFETLVLAAFFHDAYYDPRNPSKNEDESIRRFIASYKFSNSKIENDVIAMIDSTKHRKVPDQYLIRMFWAADNIGFYDGYEKLLKTEKMIRQENIHIPLSVYKKKSIEFYKTNIGLFDKEVDKDIEKLIKTISSY